MSDLESFSGFDAGSDQMSAAAFEKFKERMRAATAQLKALQASEQRQKKTEDELIKILLKFIQTGKTGEILMLVLRMLENNVPSGYIVSLLLISNREIQKELNIRLLPPPEVMQTLEKDENDAPTLLPAEYMEGKVLPLKIKISIDSWIREIHRRAGEYPQKVLQTSWSDEGVNLTSLQLATFCLRDYLESEGVAADYAKLKEFMEMTLEKILMDIKNELENRKGLKEGN